MSSFTKGLSVLTLLAAVVIGTSQSALAESKEFQEKKIRMWSIPGAIVLDRTSAKYGRVIQINDDVGDDYFNALKTRLPSQITCGHDKYGSYIYSEYHAISFIFSSEAECIQVQALFANTDEETAYDVTGRYVESSYFGMKPRHFVVVNVGPSLGEID
jgi:hypothetical protein